MHKTIGQIMAERRKALGLSQGELASALRLHGVSVTNQAVSKWESGTNSLSAARFLAICEALDIDDIRGVFTGGGGDIMRGLNAEGRRRAMEYIELLRLSGQYAAPRERARGRRLPLYSTAVSAGTGQLLDGEDYELVEVGESVPEDADFGVRIAGDSMEPAYRDGEIVWVRRRRSIAPGRVGVFLYDGEAYIKRLYIDDSGARLHSENRAYPDVLLNPQLPLRVLGEVL